MSVEFCACLPPFRMLNIGTGSVFPVPRCLYNGTPFDAAAAWATASDTPKIALAPIADLFGVPSASSIRWSTAAWSNGERPVTANARWLFTFATALLTPVPPKRSLSPSRNSTASYRPVLAPEGTAARPIKPSDNRTSTSTVGLPRESSISRLFTSTIVAETVIENSASLVVRSVVPSREPRPFLPHRERCRPARWWCLLFHRS